MSKHSVRMSRHPFPFARYPSGVERALIPFSNCSSRIANDLNLFAKQVQSFAGAVKHFQYLRRPAGAYVCHDSAEESPGSTDASSSAWAEATSSNSRMSTASTEVPSRQR